MGFENFGIVGLDSHGLDEELVCQVSKQGYHCNPDILHLNPIIRKSTITESKPDKDTNLPPRLRCKNQDKITHFDAFDVKYLISNARQ